MLCSSFNFFQQVLGAEACSYYEEDVQHERGKEPSYHQRANVCELSSGEMIDIAAR